MENQQDSNSTSQSSQDKLIDSVKASLNEAEAMLREAAASSGDRAAELREKAMISMRRTREALYDAQDVMMARGRKAARQADDYVHDNPWQAIGVAAGAGLILGLLVGRR